MKYCKFGFGMLSEEQFDRFMAELKASDDYRAIVEHLKADATEDMSELHGELVARFDDPDEGERVIREIQEAIGRYNDVRDGEAAGISADDLLELVKDLPLIERYEKLLQIAGSCERSLIADEAQLRQWREDMAQFEQNLEQLRGAQYAPELAEDDLRSLAEDVSALIEASCENLSSEAAGKFIREICAEAGREIDLNFPTARVLELAVALYLAHQRGELPVSEEIGEHATPSFFGLVAAAACDSASAHAEYAAGKIDKHDLVQTIKRVLTAAIKVMAVLLVGTAAFYVLSLLATLTIGASLIAIIIAYFFGLSGLKAFGGLIARGVTWITEKIGAAVDAVAQYGAPVASVLRRRGAEAWARIRAFFRSLADRAGEAVRRAADSAARRADQFRRDVEDERTARRVPTEPVS